MTWVTEPHRCYLCEVCVTYRSVQILGDRVLYGCACYFLHNYCSFYIAYRNAYYFSCTSQTVPDRHEVYRSFQNFWYSVQNFLHITLLPPRIRRWLLDFWKICGHLTVYIKRNHNLPSFVGLNLNHLPLWKECVQEQAPVRIFGTQRGSNRRLKKIALWGV